MTTLEFIVIFLMIAINGLFSCYEMALASISHARISVLLQDKKAGASSAAFMKERMEASLAVIQLAITLVGSIAAATGGASIDNVLLPWVVESFGFSHAISKGIALILFVLPLSLVTIIFAELIPKMFAIHNKELVCLRLSPFMHILSKLTYPLVAVFEGIVKNTMKFVHKFLNRTGNDDANTSFHEIAAAVAMARTARLIGAHEEKILLSAAQFSTRPIDQIIIPVADISTLSVYSSLIEALLKAHLDLHTRFPVCSVPDDPQTIQGYVTFKDLVVALKMNSDSENLLGITRPLQRFPQGTTIARTLEQMIREKVHIGLVESQDKKIAGLITLEDIIEELVGDIEDEFDHLPSHLHTTANGWIVGGGIQMPMLSQALGRELLNQSTGKPKILAEWVVEKLGRPVSKGEVIKIDQINITVRKIRRHKLSEAFVSFAG